MSQDDRQQIVESQSQSGASLPAGSIETEAQSPEVVDPNSQKSLLERLRERDKPLLASGEPAHGPG
jgi:hypothetical protein